MIVIILVGSKSTTNFDQESRIPLSVATKRSTDDRQGTIDAKQVHDEVDEVSNAKKSLGNHNVGSNEAENDEEEENEDDDELRRRVEEFIEKVNRGWKAEMLITRQLVSI
ncbi:uncharacterized protein LOC112491100 [Ziziphus jujuba]|uniref:Uncharacterized protein LOC112491100 n=1 Tax=Ziziphus jujuba TaxID=326968 RepID=A0A6P6G1P3_ZIZJJ|nr:uncharacterized protein LOC112491100 [Ziziphus jujuba]